MSFIVGLVATAGGAAGVVLVLNLVLDDFRTSTSALLLLTASSCGLISNVVLYYLQKQWLGPVRNGLASLLPDPDERSRLIRPFSVFWKLSTSMVAVTIVPLVFTTFLAYSKAPASVEALAAQMQEKILARALGAGGSSPESGSVLGVLGVLELARVDVRAFDLPFSLLMLDLASGEVVSGSPDALSELERHWVRDAASGPDVSAASRGNADALYSPHILR